MRRRGGGAELEHQAKLLILRQQTLLLDSFGIKKALKYAFLN